MPQSIISDLRKQIKEKDQFLATISHEIRSPMNAVFGMADALLRTDLDHIQKRYLTVLLDACESMLGIANQVLDISKTKSGRVALANVDFDLSDFMALQVAAFANRAEARNIELSLQVDFRTDPRIYFDKFRLGQIMTNLISNALRYTDSGQIIVRALLDKSTGHFLDLTLAVQDTGIGMSPRASKNIFEAFTTANPAESAARGGSGLGLTVVRDLVNLMNGRILVDTTLGEGTTFTINLQVEPQQENKIAHRPMQRYMPVGLNILLAEDNESNAFVFNVMLEETGANITRARNGAEAVTRALKQQFDVIFMDIQMPEMNGIDATRKIRTNELDAQQKPATIIALSADVFASQSSDFQNAGFNDSLSKPVRQSELLSVLSTFDKGVNFD